ncbi:TetR/AcrR family transcriptional regulator [Vibrio gangliei]|uniref:TetR/AcrR family transcriptional regulator n=1 Tax=Vibrio gangliei TaxID=2077090 RepID=UPI000D013C19|nr:TetR/AcrR family transcriptional regulator [Vibrio gangliei]
MARKSNFDKDEKLVEAMQLFWQKGYANTSISDLVDHLSINRFSIYNTFGDKYALYQSALNYYFEHSTKPASQVLFEPDANLTTLKQFLEQFAQRQKEQKFGCFIQNALLEHGISDENVHSIGEKLMNHLSDGVTNCLNNEVKGRNLNQQIDIQGLVDLTLVQIQGMRVLGKAKQYQRLDTATQQFIELIQATFAMHQTHH